MLQKLIRTCILAFAVMIVGCVDDTTAPIVDTPAVPSGMSFGLVAASTDTVLRIRVSWPQATDGAGAAEFYRHTMTANKAVTDNATGPLPTLKQVNGLADTVSIRMLAAGDTVTLTARIWSVRRGLQSVTPAEGNLVIRRADRPPPAPDSITVDTIVIPIMGGLKMGTSSLVKVAPQTTFNPFLPFKREEDGSTIEIIGNTTILTIVR
jgi:hypothetical protein